MNNPYEKLDHKYTLVTTRREYFEESDYYPSPNDTVYRLHFNTNFAPGPAFDGIPFTYPDEPFSTNGHSMSHCMQRGPCTSRFEKSCGCTNSVKIPLGIACNFRYQDFVLETWFFSVWATGKYRLRAVENIA